MSTGVASSSSEAKISSNRTPEAAEARKKSSRLLGQMEAVIKTNKVGHKHPRHLESKILFRQVRLVTAGLEAGSLSRSTKLSTLRRRGWSAKLILMWLWR